MTDTPRAYAVGDKVTVATHYTWYGRDTYGHTGVVVEIIGADTRTRVYDVDLDGFADSPVPFYAGELAPADDQAGAGS